MLKLENCDVYRLSLSCQRWLLHHCSPVFLWLPLEQPGFPLSFCPDDPCFLSLHCRRHEPMKKWYNCLKSSEEDIEIASTPLCVFSTLWMTAGSKTLQGGGGTGGMGVLSASSRSEISFCLWWRLSFRSSRRALAPSRGCSESLQFWFRLENIWLFISGYCKKSYIASR